MTLLEPLFGHIDPVIKHICFDSFDNDWGVFVLDRGLVWHFFIFCAWRRFYLIKGELCIIFVHLVVRFHVAELYDPLCINFCIFCREWYLEGCQFVPLDFFICLEKESLERGRYNFKTVRL